MAQRLHRYEVVRGQCQICVRRHRTDRAGRDSGSRCRCEDAAGIGGGDDVSPLILAEAPGMRQGRRRDVDAGAEAARSEEHTSELQSLMRISYAVFCLKKKKIKYSTT